jgi:hypothetical protein
MQTITIVPSVPIVSPELVVRNCTHCNKAVQMIPPQKNIQSWKEKTYLCSKVCKTEYQKIISRAQLIEHERDEADKARLDKLDCLTRIRNLSVDQLCNYVLELENKVQEVREICATSREAVEEVVFQGGRHVVESSYNDNANHEHVGVVFSRIMRIVA